MLDTIDSQLASRFVLTSISSWIPVIAQKKRSLVKPHYHSPSLIKIIYRGGHSYKVISINIQKTQSMKNNVPSEVADFRVLHANHAISTAGDPLRGIGFGVHLDCAEKKNESKRRIEKSKKKITRKDVKDKSPPEIDP